MLPVVSQLHCTGCSYDLGCSQPSSIKPCCPPRTPREDRCLYKAVSCKRRFKTITLRWELRVVWVPSVYSKLAHAKWASHSFLPSCLQKAFREHHVGTKAPYEVIRMRADRGKQEHTQVWRAMTAVHTGHWRSHFQRKKEKGHGHHRPFRTSTSLIVFSGKQGPHLAFLNQRQPKGL